MLWAIGIYLFCAGCSLLFLRAWLRELFWRDLLLASVWAAFWPVFMPLALFYSWKERAK